MSQSAAASALPPIPDALSVPEQWWQENIIPLLDVVALGRLACTCTTFRDMLQQPRAVDWRALAAQHFRLSDEQLQEFELLKEASPEQAKYLLRQVSEALCKYRQGVFLHTNRPMEQALFIRHDGSLHHWSRLKNRPIYVSLCVLDGAESSGSQLFTQVAHMKLVDGKLPGDGRDLKGAWWKQLYSAMWGSQKLSWMKSL